MQLRWYLPKVASWKSLRHARRVSAHIDNGNDVPVHVATPATQWGMRASSSWGMSEESVSGCGTRCR